MTVVLQQAAPAAGATVPRAALSGWSGSPLDPHVARALEHLDEMVVGQRLLGAYPADRSISHRTGPP